MTILKGDVSFITGAASGFGKALADALVQQGGLVALADINEEAISLLASQYNEKAGAIVAIWAKTDTVIFEDQALAFEAAKKAFGRIDYVFANAGIAESPWLPVWDPSTASSRPIVKPDFKTIDVDLNGQLNTAALGFQYFERQEIGQNGFRGKLILTTSLLGYYPISMMPMYATAKAGIVNYMRSAAIYYANKGITVNSIGPGLVATAVLPADIIKPFAELKLLTPISNVIDQFLSCLGTSTMNGQALSVNEDDAWVHPMQMERWDKCGRAVILLSAEVGKMLGDSE